MAKYPNTTPFKGISTSWTQPYLPTNYNPFYEPSPEHVVTVELIKLNEIDKQVEAMTEYPEALALINGVIK